jgi:hypothetical protein
VYLRPADPDQSVRLVGLRAVTAAPGETVAVEVATDARMSRRRDEVTSSWGSCPREGSCSPAAWVTFGRRWRSRRERCSREVTLL